MIARLNRRTLWSLRNSISGRTTSASLGTLRPCPDESVNIDTTENLIIEGDNLEVLKLLR